MNLKITNENLTGAADTNSWSVCSDFIPVNKDLAVQRGHVFSVISLVSQNGASLPKDQSNFVSKEILKRLYEEYFAGNHEQVAILLQLAVKKVHEIFSSPNESLQILVAAVLENKIFFCGIGKVEAWISRGGNLAKIIKSETTSNFASGIIQGGDEFFLGTTEFFTKVTPELLKSETNFTSIVTTPDSQIAAIKIKAESEGVVASQVESIQKVMPIKEENSKNIAYPRKISKLRLVAASLIDKVLVLLPEKKTYVKEEFKAPGGPKKRKITTVGAILLVLLLFSIVFGMKQKGSQESKAQYEPILASVEHDLNEAESLSSINNSRARSLILEAKEKIDNLKTQKINDPKINALSDKIQSDLGRIAGIYQEEPSLYLDLTLRNNSFKGDDMAASEGRMVVLDRNGKRLETIDIGSSRGDPAAGPDNMPNAKLVAAYSDRNFVTSSDGIWEVGVTARSVIKKDWGEDVLISAYAGNIYVLDKDKGSLWRYQGDGGEFTKTKQNWFGDGIKPDLTNIISWTIDGNIWMLSKSSQVLRFEGGSPIDFNLQNIDKDPKAVDIFTTQDSKYLYLLDKDNSRVLIIDKKGEYKAQYLAENIKNATKIVVSEEDKKIILLENEKLFSLDIKHLE